tara:strand:- start:1444 stop:1671 length:228 start_codon:yes stop_codon:yes gene_type:complete
MDVYTHTLIAVGCVAAAFYAGLYFNKRSIVNNIVTHLLETLERDGFIKTIIDKDGDVTMIPISEIERGARNDKPV